MRPNKAGFCTGRGKSRDGQSKLPSLRKVNPVFTHGDSPVGRVRVLARREGHPHRGDSRSGVGTKVKRMSFVERQPSKQRQHLRSKGTSGQGQGWLDIIIFLGLRDNRYSIQEIIISSTLGKQFEHASCWNSTDWSVNAAADLKGVVSSPSLLILHLQPSGALHAHPAG